MSEPLNGLQRQRKAAGLTLEATGALIGVTKQHVAKLERGTSPLDVKRARLLAKRFGCSIEGLL